jgi:hypothetical protein
MPFIVVAQSKKYDDIPIICSYIGADTFEYDWSSYFLIWAAPSKKLACIITFSKSANRVHNLYYS